MQYVIEKYTHLLGQPLTQSQINTVMKYLKPKHSCLFDIILMSSGQIKLMSLQINIKM